VNLEKIRTILWWSFAIVLILLILSIVALFYGFEYNRAVTQIKDFSVERIGSYEERTCQMPGCQAMSSLEQTNVITVREKKAIQKVAEFANSANYICEVRVGKEYDRETRYGRDHYFNVEPQSDGRYKVYVENDIYEYDVNVEVGTEYRMFMSGYYCKSHSQQALDAVQKEIKGAMIQNVWYLVGYALAPYNFLALVVLIIIFIIGLNVAGVVEKLKEEEIDKVRKSAKEQAEAGTFFFIVGVILLVFKIGGFGLYCASILVSLGVIFIFRGRFIIYALKI